MASVDKCLKEITSERDTDTFSLLQRELSIQSSTELDASAVERRKVKAALSKKKGSKAAPKALHERLFTAIKSLGEEDKPSEEAPVQFHEKFFTAIKTMGDACMDSLDKSFEEMSLVSKKGPKPAQLHQRLFATLELMRDFYHCGGNGLDDESLDSDEYKVTALMYH